jgi:CHAD domain-containing protein
MYDPRNTPDPPSWQPDDAPPPAARGAQSLEVELKFDVDDPESLETLRLQSDLSASYPLDDGDLADVGDTYIDTRDFALLRAGLVLRLRHKRGELLVTLKDLGTESQIGVFERSEYEGPIYEPKASHHPSAWPEEVRVRVLSVVGRKATFVPLCHVVHSRETRAARALRDQPDGGAVERPIIGELVLDKVWVSEPTREHEAGDRGVAPAGGAPAATFDEVEFEMREDGTAADLEFIRRWLTERGGLSPARHSKFEKAMRAIATHPPTADTDELGIRPEMEMSEAGRLAWRVQLYEMLLEESGARLGLDIEFVHRMRVATRRARAAHRLFGAYFEPAIMRPHLQGLRRTARALGRVRDLDVALYKLDRHREKVGRDSGPGLDDLATHWDEARREAYRRLLKWLDGQRYRKFLAGFHAFCSEPYAGVRALAPTSGAPPSTQVRHIMPLAILERFATVRGYERFINRDTEETLLHALRIDCKALRYSIEPVRELLDTDGRALIKQLKKLQDHLGDLNDAAVARTTLQELPASLRSLPGVQHYLAHQEVTIRRLADRFPKAWRAFIARENRELLMRAIARL